MIHFYQDHCKRCLHYIKDQKCKAFPDGIPAEIQRGDNFHHEAYEGDNGIRFECRPTKSLSLEDLVG